MKEPFEKPPFFDHEKLVAYQRSIQFVAWATDLLDQIPEKLSVTDQLDRASTSLPLNIAEGNGKYTLPDRCRYFETARGSAPESAACLNVLVAKGKCTTEQIHKGNPVRRVVSHSNEAKTSSSASRWTFPAAPFPSAN